MVESCASHGVERIELGMAHRGRLNVLCNLLGKSIGALCSEMEGKQSDFRVGGCNAHQHSPNITVGWLQPALGC